jgi:type VI secretion system protein ImpC
VTCPDSAPADTTVVPPSTTHDNRSVLANLFEKIDLISAYEAQPLEGFEDRDSLSAAPIDERLSRALGVLMEMLADSDRPVGSVDKSLLDFHIDVLDRRVNKCLDVVMHSTQFQTIESSWRGLKFLVDQTDPRKNVKIEVLDCAKETLQQDFDDTPEVIQSGLYHHAYIQEYDTPGGQPISAVISDFEFVNSAKDIALLRNISKVAAAAHMPFIGVVSAEFFGRKSMEDVVAIQDIGDYFDRPDYLKWMAFRRTEDARYIGLTMPRVLGRRPYGPGNTPVRNLNYRETLKGTDRDRFLWVSASFAFAANMVRSFERNGWCVQVRGPHAGGKVAGLPVHEYELGVGFQNKISAEVLIPETREFEFANLGFIPLSFFENHDFACFFSANSVQKPAAYATPEATGNSRINARLPYIFLLSRIAHHLKLIQRENIGTTKDRRLLEVELNNWIKTLVTEMTDPNDDLQAAHPLRQAEVTVEDIEDNPGFFRVRLFVVPHFQVEGMDVGLSMVSQMPRDKTGST